MTAKSKLLELINAGKIPSNFSYLGNDHEVTTTQPAFSDWRADNDCSEVVPFCASIKGPSNISQRPRNAAYAVSVGGSPALGTDETRGNIIRRPVLGFPEWLSGNKVLHLSAYESPLVGGGSSLATIEDKSDYSQTFVPYKSDSPVTMDKGSVYRVPNYVFSGRECYIYADSADDWDAGNDSAEPDHLVSISGSTIYLSFIAYASNTITPFTDGPGIDTEAASGGGFNINESLHYCILNTSNATPGTGPKIYSAAKTSDVEDLSAIVITDETVNSVANKHGDLLVIEQTTGSLDFDLYLSEIFIYDTGHSKDEIDDGLRYLYCRNHIGGSDVSGSLAAG